MAKFKDANGREWPFAIDVQAIKDVALHTGVKIHKLLADDAAALQELLGDPVAFVDVLFVLVGGRPGKAEPANEDFARALGGDSLEDAANAFMEALADFSPGRQRKVIRALTAKGNEVADRVMNLAMAKIQTMDLMPTPSSSPTSSPESSASIPPA